MPRLLSSWYTMATSNVPSELSPPPNRSFAHSVTNARNVSMLTSSRGSGLTMNC